MKKPHITDIPQKIYIQLDYNNELEHEEIASFKDWREEATWCVEIQNKTDVVFYSHEHLERMMQAAFEHGWRMRMNRKASECKSMMDNCITLLLLD